MGRKRAAIYCRVSTEEQASEGQSISAQRKILREYAERNGYEVVEEFIDEAVSARSADRPEFQRMITLAKRKPRPFDVILVHKWDRFARNREDSIVYKKLLRRDCGIELISVSEPLEDGPVGVLLEGILELLAEFYSLNLAQEVKKGMREKANKGQALGMVPFGYRAGPDGRYVVEPTEAEIVRWIYDSYLAGHGQRAIYLQLVSDGVARWGEAVTRYKWSPAAVRVILRNPIYTGRFVWNRRQMLDGGRYRYRPESEWIVTENAHEAIIGQATWDEVQRVMQGRRKPRSPSGDYLLFGMVRCLDCGGPMSQWKFRGHHRVRCTTAVHTDRCYFNWVEITALEQALVAFLRDFAAGRVPLADVQIEFVSRDAPAEELDRARKALQGLDAKFDRQLQAYEAGVISIEQLKAARSRLDEERIRLEQQIAELERRVNMSNADQARVLRDRVPAILETATNPDLPIPERRRALQQIISRVEYSRRTDTLRVVLKL